MILPGKLLKEARQGAGLTQADLAERLATSQSVIARLESGRANPRVETFQRAVAATGHRLAVDLEPAGWPPIDESLIREARRFSPADRLRAFESSYGEVKSLAERALTRRGP
jgi:transcriptional regulator with XRE-family HTH domain